MTFYNPSAQSRHRSRSYSLSQPTQMGYPYPTTSTPYSAYNSLPPTQFDPGYNTNQTFYVAPSISGRSRGRSRSRSRSRPAHGHSHGHGHSHSQRRSRSHNRHHGHQRRSHSTTSHRLQRPSHHPGSYQPQTRITYPRQTYHSPTIGERILKFFGLGHNDRYVDQYNRTVDNRGRPIRKY